MVFSPGSLFSGLFDFIPPVAGCNCPGIQVEPLCVSLPRMSSFWKTNVNWVLLPVRAAGWIACCARVKVAGEIWQALTRLVLHKCLGLVGICSIRLRMFSLSSGHFPPKCPWHFSQGTIIVFIAVCSHTENAVINYSTVPVWLRVCLLG